MSRSAARQTDPEPSDNPGPGSPGAVRRSRARKRRLALAMAVLLPLAGLGVVYGLATVVDSWVSECGVVERRDGAGDVAPDGAVYLYHMYLDGLGVGDDWWSGPVRRDVVDPPLKLGETVSFDLTSDFEVVDLKRAACDV